MLVVTSSAVSDQGNVRSSNQDSYINEVSSGLFCVADGMGGNAGGDVASRYAVKLIKSFLKQYDSQTHGELKEWWNLTFKQICLRLYEYALENPQYRGMGTTVSLVHYKKEKKSKEVLIVHVGDSRVYWMRDNFLYQVTQDHSLVSEKIRAGILKEDDPLIKSMKNILTRSIGHQEDEEIDVSSIEACEGDRFLICSDGLSNKVSDEEIQEALMKFDEKVCQSLVDLAKERGGEDNITVVVGEFS
jgi:protein phosphatase